MQTYYHGSPIGGIEHLMPKASWFDRDDKPYVYLTSNKPHATIYAAKSYIYPYGFNREKGIVLYSEPYSGFLKDTYLGKSGYLYRVEEVRSIKPKEGILYAHYTSESVRVASVEYIANIYDKLFEYEAEDLIEIVPFSKTKKKLRERNINWATKVLAKEKFFTSTEDYPRFLKEKFPEAWKNAREIREQGEKK